MLRLDLAPEFRLLKIETNSAGKKRQVDACGSRRDRVKPASERSAGAPDRAASRGALGIRSSPRTVRSYSDSAAIIERMFSLAMNDTAADLLGVLGGLAAGEPPGGLAPSLREHAAQGLSRRGELLTWASSVGNTAGTPSFFNDLTAWECSDSSLHLEDFVPVDVTTVDGAPVISDDGQRMLLMQGVAFALEFSRLVYALDPPSPVRCIVGANDTNATFRFHQIRSGESWNMPDLDKYGLDKMVVADITPAVT
ncbi:hypothetical protein ACWGHM_15030 [Streptomyces sp. NPDC054904]